MTSYSTFFSLLPLHPPHKDTGNGETGSPLIHFSLVFKCTLYKWSHILRHCKSRFQYVNFGSKIQFIIIIMVKGSTSETGHVGVCAELMGEWMKWWFLYKLWSSRGKGNCEYLVTVRLPRENCLSEGPGRTRDVQGLVLGLLYQQHK